MMKLKYTIKEVIKQMVKMINVKVRGFKAPLCLEYNTKTIKNLDKAGAKYEIIEIIEEEA